MSFALFGDEVAGLLETSVRIHGKAVIWDAVPLAIMWCILERAKYLVLLRDLKFQFWISSSFFFLERYTFGLQQWAVFISKKMLDFLFLTC